MDIHPRVYGRETALYIGRGGVGFPYVAFLLFFSFVLFRPRLKSTYMQRKKQLVGEEKEKTKKKNCIFRRTFFCGVQNSASLPAPLMLFVFYVKGLKKEKKKGLFRDTRSGALAVVV